MNANLHYPTCLVWVSSNLRDCTCHMRPWRIRKEAEEKFPWRVWRLTEDQVYVAVMRCSSFRAAVSLVDSLQWLRMQAMVRHD